MRIAVQNSWPNLDYSAEREFIARLKRVCTDLGWVCIEAVTSEEIINANPDCVLVTHECSPKLTGIPTIGLMWSPPDFYRDDPSRIRSILSYDGYLAGSASVREFLDDLLFSTRKNTPISDWDFLPTAPLSEFRSPSLHAASLFYTGVHWDKGRHEKLMKGLNRKLPLAFYGDPGKWAKFGSAYKGRIPFDGKSVFEKIHEAGVALCLHRKEHLKHDVPSMRIFEAAAGGAVIITENASFTKKNFGDSVLYIDQDASIADKVSQISAHYEWILRNSYKALEMAARSNAIFNQHFSLEKLLMELPGFVQKVRAAGYFDVCTNEVSAPKVDVIVRIGGRGLDLIERCLDSLAAQSYANLGLVLVKYREVAGLENLLHKYNKRFASIQQIQSKATGFRSTSLWDGIRAVEAEYFCNQDDDDTVNPNHISTLVNLLESEKCFHVAYSGCVQVQDEPGYYYHYSNFTGPLGVKIKENRSLIFFDPFHRQRFLRADNFIQSNAWLARSSLLQPRDLIDPLLEVSEDMYLYRLFLRQGDFLFSWHASANWHMRSVSGDNSVTQVQLFNQCGERVKLRTRYFNYAENSYEGLSRKILWLLVKAYANDKFPYLYAKLKLISKLIGGTN